jgi:FtsP/CotA-like multicopper oxidase with cupredoxin domain
VLNRRDLIKLGLYGGTAGMLHLTRLDSGVLAWALDEVKGNSNLQSQSPAAFKPFTKPLPLPHLITPVNPSTLPGVPFIPGATYYEVSMRQGAVQLFPTGLATVIWRYQPTYQKTYLEPTHLGPTFEARIGETTVVRQHNDLPVTTIVHHHGGHTPGVSDGAALLSQRVQPGTFKDYIYPNDDDICATHWYHDHDLDFTGHNVFMGLQGYFLLHDAVEDELNLPGGPRDPAPPSPDVPFDLPLVLQDRIFDFNNQLSYNPFGHDGCLGDHFLVNGAIQPSVRVANRKYRLRFLNGSNARFYQLSLSNGMPFHMIGSDGGLLSDATDVKSFLIGSSERYEAIVDFSKLTPGPNTHVYLNNCMAQTNGRAPDGLSTQCTNAHPGPDGVGSLLRFNVAFSAADPSTFRPGQTLRTDLPIYGSPTVTRNWLFERSNGAWQINGQFYDPNRIDAHVKLNTTEMWVLQNGGGGWWHPVHIHRNQFRIVDRNGQAPGPLEGGLKDVFVLGAGDTVSVKTYYNGNAQVGNYVMHCHNVEHEDMRMMMRWTVS